MQRGTQLGGLAQRRRRRVAARRLARPERAQLVAQLVALEAQLACRHAGGGDLLLQHRRALRRAAARLDGVLGAQRVRAALLLPRTQLQSQLGDLVALLEHQPRRRRTTRRRGRRPRRHAAAAAARRAIRRHRGCSEDGGALALLRLALRLLRLAQPLAQARLAESGGVEAAAERGELAVHVGLVRELPHLRGAREVVGALATGRVFWQGEPPGEWGAGGRGVEGEGGEGGGKGGRGARLLLEQLELRLAVVPVAAPPPLRLLELPLLSKGLSARRMHLGAALRRQLRQLHAQLGGLERLPLRLRLRLRQPGLVAPPRALLGAQQGACLPGGQRRRVGAAVRRGGGGVRRAREGERVELLLLERREPRAKPLQQLLLLLEARGVRRLLVELLPRALPPLAHGAEHVRLRRAQQLLELDRPRLRPPRRPLRLAARPLLRLGRLRRLGRLGPLGDQLALQPRRRGLVRRNLGLELGVRRREPRLRLL